MDRIVAERIFHDPDRSGAPGCLQILSRICFEPPSRGGEIEEDEFGDTGWAIKYRIWESKMKDLQLKDERIYRMVRDESIRQILKWGIQDRHPFEWLAYLTEEQGELAKAISEFEYRKGLQSEVVNEAIQTATLSLKIAEIFLNLEVPK